MSVTENLVDTVWGADRPPRPHEKVFVHEVLYAGESVADKYRKVANKLNKSVDVLLVTTLDDIAWFLNLRGKDIHYNPVFFSYLLFHVPTNEQDTGRVQLFINKDKVSEDRVQTHL